MVSTYWVIANFEKNERSTVISDGRRTFLNLHTIQFTAFPLAVVIYFHVIYFL